MDVIADQILTPVNLLRLSLYKFSILLYFLVYNMFIGHKRDCIFSFSLIRFSEFGRVQLRDGGKHLKLLLPAAHP